jgi:MFS transporter
MLDLPYFRKPTYLGANPAQFSFAAGMLTMLTFIPVFLQSGLGQTSAIAGMTMLPLAVPVFIVPRIVSQYLAHRLSGRALLSLGLPLVCLGLFWLAAVVRELGFEPMIRSMLIMGTGARVLNGEITKVGMTVIPKERAGLASGALQTR